MRAGWFVIAMLALAACEAEPNLAAGVGFGDYQTYLAQREAALRGTAPASTAPPAVATPAVGALVADPITTAPITAGPITSGPISSQPLSAIPLLQPEPARGAPVPVASGGASNLAAYALQATNRLGQPVWQRSGLSLANHDRACARFISSDRAQVAFLERGGPERDPGNLDPDGDGFACAWDPTPFQAARN